MENKPGGIKYANVGIKVAASAGVLWPPDIQLQIAFGTVNRITRKEVTSALSSFISINSCYLIYLHQSYFPHYVQGIRDEKLQNE